MTNFDILIELRALQDDQNTIADLQERRAATFRTPETQAIRMEMAAAQQTAVARATALQEHGVTGAYYFSYAGPTGMKYVHLPSPAEVCQELDELPHLRHVRSAVRLADNCTKRDFGTGGVHFLLPHTHGPAVTITCNDFDAEGVAAAHDPEQRAAALKDFREVCDRAAAFLDTTAHTVRTRGLSFAGMSVAYVFPNKEMALAARDVMWRHCSRYCSPRALEMAVDVTPYNRTTDGMLHLAWPEMWQGAALSLAIQMDAKLKVATSSDYLPRMAMLRQAFAAADRERDRGERQITKRKK